MEVYTSEHEQVEALRHWWVKNGRNVIIAMAVIAAAILGWRAWQNHQHARAAEAAAIYQSVIEEQDPAKVLEKGRGLLTNYSDTAYSSLTSLAMASAAAKQNDLDGAAAHLRAAMGNTEIPGVKQTATVRLAYILLSQGKSKEALAVLDDAGTEQGGFNGAFDEARGDVQLAMGNRAAARKSYQMALSAYGDGSPKQNLVQMKIDDLAGEG